MPASGDKLRPCVRLCSRAEIMRAYVRLLLESPHITHDSLAQESPLARIEAVVVGPAEERSVQALAQARPCARM